MRNIIDHVVNPNAWEAPDRRFAGHRDIITKSLARYFFVLQFLHGRMLDIGCGRGYGLEIGKNQGRTQVGLDVSFEFLSTARTLLPEMPLIQARGGVSFPFVSHSFDAITAFEVIEHIHDDRFFVNELKRLVSPNGSIVISTPNKLVASGNAEKPFDVWHCREYTGAEFKSLMWENFAKITIYSQFESASQASVLSRFINLIPIRWKYLLPGYVQDLLSVTLRSPLQLTDCRIEVGCLDHAHTFIAVCKP